MPPAEFSPLAIARSILSLLISAGTRSLTAFRPGRPTTSPKIRIRIYSLPLPGVFYGPDLADDRDFDLSRISHLVFDFMRDLARHPRRFFVGDRVVLDDDADLPSGLNGVRLLHARKRVADS